MGDYYKLVVPEERRHESWTTEVVLERDDDGNVTKSVRADVPSELSASDKKKVEELGFEVEKVSKQEAEELTADEGQEVSANVAGQSPVFGDEGNESRSGGKSK